MSKLQGTSGREGAPGARPGGLRLRAGWSVLLRDHTTVQVGLARPLILADTSAAERDFLASLEDSAAAISATMLRRFPHVVAALEQHGALEPIPDRAAAIEAGASPASAVVRIHGLGAIGAALAVTLARADVGALALVDESPAGLEPPGTYGLGTPHHSCSAATAWMLRERCPWVRLAAPFERAAVEVVIGHGAIPAHLAATLTYRGVPHVPLIADEQGATVGPVVVPGATACLRCAELELASRDAARARLAMQCAGSRRPRVGAVASEVAAALAARAVMGVLDGRGGSVEGGSEAGGWHVDSATGTPRPVPMVAPHPDCGCGAAGPVGDEVAARRAAMHAL